MSEASEARLSVRADHEAARRVRDFASRFAARHRVRDDDRGRILVAIEELVTNLVKYGYRDATQPGSAEVTVRLDGEWLSIEIDDDGGAFDPFTQPEPNLDVPLEERQVGGLGLLLVKGLMERWRYRRQGNRNIAEIARRVTHDSAGTP
jgi:anti-sigma regulatory factor (Ser/Thr protein kinase)